MGDAAVGRLVVVGTGIRTVGQLTTEAIAWLRAADVVMHLVADPVAEELVLAWHPGTSHDLRVHYVEGRPRREAYDAMVEAIVDQVVAGKVVCAAFYGHPGVFARPTHEAVAAVRHLGARAEMLPAVSAEDCLFADLGVDPGDGTLSFEATNFVCFDHAADPTVHLVLWQVGLLGDWTHRNGRIVSANLQVLVDKLATWYPLHHEVVVYEAATSLGRSHREHRVPLCGLPDAAVTTASTLHVPPALPLSPDHAFGPRLLVTR